MNEETRQRQTDDVVEDEPVVDVWTDEEIREEEIREMENELSEPERQSLAEQPLAEERMKKEEIGESQYPVMEKELVPLLGEEEAEEFRSRWLYIQTDFVDDPRNSVEKANELVARVINSITETFASERTSLENQWNRGEEASTEDLRLAMKRYRSFFNRLLTLEASGTAE